MQEQNPTPATIPVDELLAALTELSNILGKEVRDADAQAYGGGSEYYVSDMQGYSRGLYMAKDKAIQFLKERLVKPRSQPDQAITDTVGVSDSVKK